MTEVEIINNQEESYDKFPKYVDDFGDVYDARCAEIFITLNRVLVFHCSFCNKVYRRFQYFLEHLSLEHYGNIQENNCEAELQQNFQPGLDEDLGEAYNEEGLGPLDETLHEYDELKYDCKSEETKMYKTEISDSDSLFASSQNEDFVEQMEASEVTRNHKYVDDEHQSKSKQIEEENFSLGKRKKNLDSRNTKELKPKRKKKKGLFKCDICSKTFEQRYYLKNHLIIHSSERKHKCEFCGFAFKDPSNLKSHVYRCHTGQKNISCDICGKKFFTRTETESHIRTHTGEKPYICSFCGLGFQTASKMTSHSKRHSEKAPLQCSYCQKGFWEKGDLKGHLLVHTKEKPFACPICSNRFPRRTSLRRHFKIHQK